MKKFLLSMLVMLCASVAASAATIVFTVDDLSYQINTTNSNIAMVVKGNDYATALNGELNIPAEVTYNGTAYAVTSIDYEAFRGCSGLTGVNLPSTMEHIFMYAFADCANITSMTLPNGMKTIGDGAFMNCSSLASLTLPSTIIMIGDFAFSSCSKLRNVYAYFDPANVSMGNAVWQMVLLPQPWNPAVNLHVYPQYVDWYVNQPDSSPWVSDTNRFNVMGDLGQSLTLKGSFDGWGEGVPFEVNADGLWEVTLAMDADAEFKLLDQDNSWWGGVDEYGGGYFMVTDAMVTGGTALSLVDGSNFRMETGGKYTFTADMVNKTLVISREAAPEYGHVYIMGLVSNAANEGVDMDTEDGDVYTKDIVVNHDMGYVGIYFTTQLGTSAGDYATIYQYCLGSVPADIMDFEVEVTDAMMGQELAVQQGNKYFKLVNGEYTLTLNLRDKKLVVERTDAPAYLKGDVNGDGEVDVRDITALIDVIMNSVTDNPRADVSEDGEIDVRDITALIDIIMNS